MIAVLALKLVLYWLLPLTTLAVCLVLGAADWLAGAPRAPAWREPVLVLRPAAYKLEVSMSDIYIADKQPVLASTAGAFSQVNGTFPARCEWP